MSRGERRYRTECIHKKRERKFYSTGLYFRPYEHKLTTMLETPRLCSCCICGNPRKYYNEKTRQELKMDLTEEEFFNEL